MNKCLRVSMLASVLAFTLTSCDKPAPLPPPPHPQNKTGIEPSQKGEMIDDLPESKAQTCANEDILFPGSPVPSPANPFFGV